MIRKLLIVLLLLISSCGNIDANGNKTEATKTESIENIDFKEDLKIDSLEIFLAGKPEDHLYDALLYYDVHHPEIVYAQALLETGHFKSKGCRHKNNLFGIMKGNKLRTFDHWTESIIYYKEHIQNRYKGGDYYRFLKRIGYASDQHYTARVKRMVSKL